MFFRVSARFFVLPPPRRHTTPKRGIPALLRRGGRAGRRAGRGVRRGRRRGVVVAPHGSGLSNAVWLGQDDARPPPVVVELLPWGYPNLTFYVALAALGARHLVWIAEVRAVVAKRQNGWLGRQWCCMASLLETFRASENNFLCLPTFWGRLLIADARLCCAKAPAHRHAAPRRPRSESFTWQRLRCPKGLCIGKRGEGR